MFSKKKKPRTLHRRKDGRRAPRVHAAMNRLIVIGNQALAALNGQFLESAKLDLAIPNNLRGLGYGE